MEYYNNNSNQPFGSAGTIRSTGLPRLLRPLFLLAVLGLAAACSEESGVPVVPEPPATSADPIAFSSGLASTEDITRASGLENDATTFRVWAYKNMSHDNSAGYGDLQTVIDGYTVNWIANTANTTSSNTNDWEYVNQQPEGSTEQSIKYWDWSATAYRFFGTTATTVTPDTTDPTAVIFTFSGLDATKAAVAPYYSKLWFSTGNLVDYPDKQFGKPVKMEFVKPFARVRFIFTFADGLSLGPYDLSGISFRPADLTKGIATEGTVVISYPLAGDGTKETWSSTPTPDGGMEYFSKPDQWYTVLPIAAQGAYTVKVVVVGGDAKTAVVPAEFMSWTPGYQYTYRFKITEGGGVTLDDVQVAINSWVDGGDVDHPIYNW